MRTPAQKISANKYARRVYTERRTAGLCVLCSSPPRPNRVTCEVCYKKQTANQLVRRQRNADLGLCSDCGKNPRQGERKKCTECRQKYINYWKKNNRQKLKLQIYEKYGGAKCNCCGESLVQMLSIDHINNDGAFHRSKTKHRNYEGSDSIYRWLIKNNYPPGFQVLCFNCNIAKHYNGGTCPHKAPPPPL